MSSAFSDRPAAIIPAHERPPMTEQIPSLTPHQSAELAAFLRGLERRAVEDLTQQSRAVAGRLQTAGLQISEDKEIIALIAYLQRLGTDISKPAPATTAAGGR